MELDESHFAANIIGSRKIWEPMSVELKDKSGAPIEAVCTWVFIFEGNLVSSEQYVEQIFTPSIEHLGQK